MVFPLEKHAPTWRPFRNWSPHSNTAQDEWSCSSNRAIRNVKLNRHHHRVNRYTHINSPSEGADGSSNNRVLVYLDEFFVLENRYGLFGRFGELKRSR